MLGSRVGEFDFCVDEFKYWNWFFRFRFEVFFGGFWDGDEIVGVEVEVVEYVVDWVLGVKGLDG